MLARNPSGGTFPPLAADVSGQASFDDGLGAVAFQQATPPPSSATAGQQAALADISSRLRLGCDARVTSATSWSCVIARNLAARPFEGLPATGQMPGRTGTVSEHQPPASLTNDLFATASPDTQAAGFYPPWSRERAHLVPGAKALPSIGGLCSG